MIYVIEIHKYKDSDRIKIKILRNMLKCGKIWLCDEGKKTVHFGMNSEAYGEYKESLND